MRKLFLILAAMSFLFISSGCDEKKEEKPDVADGVVEKDAESVDASEDVTPTDAVSVPGDVTPQG
jgi:protein involved in sex pheromone biosynthesis